MQEIDLPAFDAAVKAGVGAVMCSYNRINSVYACQDPYTLHDVLDGQFGFSGFVMSLVLSITSSKPSSSRKCSRSDASSGPQRRLNEPSSGSGSVGTWRSTAIVENKARLPPKSSAKAPPRYE